MLWGCNVKESREILVPVISTFDASALPSSSSTPWATCEVTRWCRLHVWQPSATQPGRLPSISVCAGPPCTNPWYHPSILDMVSLSVLCPPSHQTLWLLTFVRPSSGKCGQRIAVFSVLWCEKRFCRLQCASSLLHCWLSVATWCAKSTCNTSFQRQVVCLCQAFSMSMSH